MTGRVTSFAERVRACWSVRTATTYNESSPARGQCSVTALLAQEQLGGELLKTRVGEAWHFYNRIGGERVDFTRDQFDQFLAYDDVPATRDEGHGGHQLRTTCGVATRLQRAGCLGGQNRSVLT